MPPQTSWAPHYLIRWLFNQDSIWITAEGEKKCVQAMDRDHALNTVLFLERVGSQIEGFLGKRVFATPLYAALKERARTAEPPSGPPPPPGARFKVIVSAGPGDQSWTTYLKEFPQDDGKEGSFPMYAQGWDPEDPGRGETRILMTRAEAETVEAL